MRLKAHHLGFQTHFESYVSDTFSHFYHILIFKCFFQWRTVYKVIKIEIFSKLLYFWKLCSRHTFTAESKWNQHAKKWPILIILCAFERLGHTVFFIWFSRSPRIFQNFFAFGDWETSPPKPTSSSLPHAPKKSKCVVVSYWRRNNQIVECGPPQALQKSRYAEGRRSQKKIKVCSRVHRHQKDQNM